MQVELHKCRFVPKLRYRVEVSAELLQESLESAAWLVAQPALPYRPVNDQTEVPGAPGGEPSLAAVPAHWRPPGTCQRAESCGYLGYSQLCVVCVVPETRARYSLFHFFPLSYSSREGGGSKEKEKEEIKLYQT